MSVDLFEIIDRSAGHYPDVPGWKARDTSRAAADDQKPKAPRLRQMCLDELKRSGPLTADECAQRLAIDRLSVRPRFSELTATHEIVDTGARRQNGSGKSAIVWRLA